MVGLKQQTSTVSKLYYKDPLKAAIMSRDFGVEIQMNAFVSPYEKDSYELRTVPLWVILRDMVKKDLDTGGNEYIVSPDSYHIFQPMVGDLVRIRSWVDPQILWKERHSIPEVFKYVEDILQRNNLHFFMPEREDE